MRVEIHIDGVKKMGWYVEDEIGVDEPLSIRMIQREEKVKKLVRELREDLRRAYSANAYEIYIFYPSKLNNQV